MFSPDNWGDSLRRVLITASEAAVWTGRPQGTIRRWAQEGRLTVTKDDSGVMLFDIRELDPKNDDGPGSAPPFKTTERVADGTAAA